MANLTDYKKDLTPFLSEFGLQSAPDVESLKKFLPEDRLFPPNDTWVYHHAELMKLERYARAVNPEANSLNAFVAATQRAQAHGLQVAIEHVRRRKGATAGVAIWQFNDAWPAISWSVVDYYGMPKRAYGELICLYSPVLASFEYASSSAHKQRSPGGLVRGRLWLINDSLSAFETLDLHVLLNGSEIDARRVSLVPDSVESIGSLDVQLGKGDNILRLVLQDSARVLSDHEYDLNFRDRGRINPLVALLYPVYMKLLQ
jgi:beta-mannosidase